MKDLPFSFYEFLAVLMPGFIVTMTCFTALGAPWHGLDLNTTINSLYILCCSYIVGQVLGQLSVLLVEKPAKLILGEPALVILGKVKPFSLFKCFFKLYYEKIPDRDISRYLGLIDSEDKEKIISITMNTVFSKARQTPHVSEKLQGWSRLMGFSRNVCLAFICLAILFLFDEGLVPGANTSLIAYAFLFISAVMFYRYLRFLRVFNVELIQWYNTSQQQHS